MADLMIYHDLGRTGLKVSEIGLGTEHLGRTSKAKENVTSVVDRTVENGINYFDLIFNFKEYIENLGRALKDQQDCVSKVAKTEADACILIEAGFEFVCDFNGNKLFRKPKY